MSTSDTYSSASPIASSSKSSSRLELGDDGNLKEFSKEFESDLDEYTVHDLIDHFFANPPPSSPASVTAFISPELTISLPYYPLSPPNFDEVFYSRKNTLERSVSAKSLALFHVPMVVNTLPRSAWTLKIGNISRVDSPSDLLEHSRSLELDSKFSKLEIWTAELQWTLKFGSIATTSGISSPSLSYQAGKPVGTGGFDDWISVGEKRKVELAFVEVGQHKSGEKAVECGSEEEKGKGKGKENRKGDERKKVQLIHIRLLLPPSSTTPSHLLTRLPRSLQPATKFVVSKVIGPIFLHTAFSFLRYFNLDQASSRLQLPETLPLDSSRHDDESSNASRSRSRSRSRSKTRRHLTGRPKEENEDLLSRPPFSLVPSVPPLHVEVPVPKPSKEEEEALEILRHRSTSPTSRITPESTTISSQSGKIVDVSFFKETILVLLTIPISLISALVLELSALYYLIARFVVLFTQVVWAAGGVLKETITAAQEKEEGVIGIGITVGGERIETRRERIGRERLERISEMEELEEANEEIHMATRIKAEEMRRESEMEAAMDRSAIARGSPPLSPTPPIYHHPRLRGKRVSFPSLFATVIGQSSSSPQISLPPSPSHSPAPLPPPPPPSAADSPETHSVLGSEEPSTEDYPIDPRMYNLPSIATADTHEAVHHFNVYHQAAVAGSRFHSILALPEHGIDRGELGEEELRVWKEVGKEASQVGKELSTEIRMQVAVEETEDELEKKREDLIEKTWNEEMKEEGFFGGEEEDLERRKMKNLVGKEASHLAVERMQGGNEEEVDRKLLRIEKQVEERRKKMIEQAMENEGGVGGEEIEEVGEGDEASRSFHTAISSSSDYPTPSSRLSDPPIPETSSFEPASPTESESSHSSSPSTIRDPGTSRSITVQPINVAADASPPASPEVSKSQSTTDEKKLEKPDVGGTAGASGSIHVPKGSVSVGSVEGAIGKEETGISQSKKSKSKKKKGKK